MIYLSIRRVHGKGDIQGASGTRPHEAAKVASHPALPMNPGLAHARNTHAALTRIDNRKLRLHIPSTIGTQHHGTYDWHSSRPKAGHAHIASTATRTLDGNDRSLQSQQ